LEAGQGQGQGKVGPALNTIDGRREQLEGKIQQRYGLAKDQVRRDVDDWYASQQWEITRVRTH
jgi:uncharacterized protein YjbJ (UPF0337 family)